MQLIIFTVEGVELDSVQINLFDAAHIDSGGFIAGLVTPECVRFDAAGCAETMRDLAGVKGVGLLRVFPAYKRKLSSRYKYQQQTLDLTMRTIAL